MTPNLFRLQTFLIVLMKNRRAMSNQSSSNMCKAVPKWRRLIMHMLSKARPILKDMTGTTRLSWFKDSTFFRNQIRDPLSRSSIATIKDSMIEMLD